MLQAMSQEHGSNLQTVQMLLKKNQVWIPQKVWSTAAFIEKYVDLLTALNTEGRLCVS